MRKRLVLTLAALLACAAFATPVKAITGNYEKDFVHDYVGLMVFYTTPDPDTGDPFSHRCSGSLISPTVMVTAGHCTAGVDTGRVYFQQSVAPNYDPDAFGGFGGDPTTGYPYENGITFSRADNYGFDEFVTYPDTHDVGVVVLDEPYNPPSGTFAILPEPGLDRRTRRGRGQQRQEDAALPHRRLWPERPGPPPGLDPRAADRLGLPDRRQQRRHRVQPEDDCERVEGQGRLVQRRLRRTGPRRRHERHGWRRLVRDEPAVQGPGLLVPPRPAAGPRLDHEPEPPGRWLGPVTNTPASAGWARHRKEERGPIGPRSLYVEPRMSSPDQSASALASGSGSSRSDAELMQ